MALATRCPHCDTTFRVASDQLKLRGGIVRCGTCHEIFDGNASLVDLDKAPTEAPSPPIAEEAVAEVQPGPAADQADVTGAPEDELPIYTLNLESTLDPLGILPEPEAGEPAPDADESEDELTVIEVDASETAGDALPAAVENADGSAHAVDARVNGASTAPEDVPENETTPASTETPQDAVETIVDVTGHAAQDSIEAPGHAAEASVEASPDAPGAQEMATAGQPEHAGHADHAALEDHAPPAHSHEPASAPPPAALPLRESSDFVHYTAAPPAAPKSARARAGARRSKLTPTKIAPPKFRVPEIDEPEFVKRGRQREQTSKRRLVLMGAGSVLLALLLLAQAATAFRADLVARYPATRPALASLCALLRCRVELPARIDNLAIETGELQTLAPDTYALSTLLHNQAALTQAWPDIELALNDANDKPLVRRVFTPADYLPKGGLAAAGFGAHAEQPVRLTFQLDQLKPSGYHIAIFYP
jgi:predicted Zn finger-like uncharacterized protein